MDSSVDRGEWDPATLTAFGVLTLLQWLPLF